MSGIHKDQPRFNKFKLVFLKIDRPDIPALTAFSHISFLLKNESATSPDRALNEFIPATKSELDVAIRESANILKE